MIAADPPAVVHLITRAQGGIHDYQAFLHEAGHALHYAGCDPDAPYTFRRPVPRPRADGDLLVPRRVDHPRAGLARGATSTLDEETARENAEATRFLEAILFRRYAAKLGYELDLWGDFEHATDYAGVYEEKLRAATGVRYRADNYLADLDEGFYSADYLRAWIRTAQVRDYLRAEIGEDWWAASGDRRVPAHAVPPGHKPSSEDVAAQVGYDPLDTAPLLSELSG